MPIDKRIYQLALDGLDELERHHVAGVISDVRKVLLTCLRLEIDSEEGKKAEMELPDDCDGNPIYKAYLLNQEEIPEPSPLTTMGIVGTNNPITTDRNVLPLTPKHPDKARIIRTMEKLAGNIIETMCSHIIEDEQAFSDEEIEKAVHTVRNALVHSLGTQLLRADRYPILRKDILKVGSKEERYGISTRDVRRAVKKVGSLNLDPEKAEIELMVELGLISKEELTEEKIENIKEYLEESREQAWKLYVEIAKSLIDAQRSKGIDGERILIDPNISLKSMNLFQLLDFVINHNGDGNKQNQNEAQTVAYLNYLFFAVNRHPIFRAALKIKNEMSQKATQNFFVDETFTECKLYEDLKGNIVGPNPIDEDVSASYLLRTAKPIRSFPKFGSQRVYFEDFDRKEESSIVKKLLLNPSYDIEELPDVIRGRVVVWDITKADLENPETVEYLMAFTRQFGVSLGLNYAQYEKARKKGEELDRSDLKDGEMTIINKLNHNKGNKKSNGLKVIKLYGKTKEGIRVEVQVIIREEFQALKSRQSPINDWYYKMNKDTELAEIIYRGHKSDRVRAIARRIYAFLRNSRAQARKQYDDACREAMHIELAENTEES
ncbi:hypothetical protein KKC94_01460 [Patescibacteria group bacterium]|nr:hypothetical protein [Patescibacteria group bacterium]